MGYVLAINKFVARYHIRLDIFQKMLFSIFVILNEILWKTNVVISFWQHNNLLVGSCFSIKCLNCGFFRKILSAYNIRGKTIFLKIGDIRSPAGGILFMKTVCENKLSVTTTLGRSGLVKFPLNVWDMYGICLGNK
jgi:hypothetical protein